MPFYRLTEQESEVIHVLQRYACSAGNRVQRIVGNVELNRDLIRQAASQTVQQRATTGQVDTTLYDIAKKLQ